VVLSIESQLGSIPEGKSTKKSIRRNGNLATGGYKRNESATRSDSTYVEVDKTEDIVRFLVYDRRSENDQCGLMFPNANALRSELSWTQYRSLMRVKDEEARNFYMNEAVKAGWSSRQLDSGSGARNLIMC